MKIKNKIKLNGGAAMMVLVFFFVFISLTILMGIVSPAVREFKITNDSFLSKQTYFLAESGVEDVLYRLKNNKQVSGTETLVLGSSSSITSITDIGGGQKEIDTLGNTNSHQRKIDVVLNTATGVSFNYGVLVGQGGVTLNGSGVINGNVYADGPIVSDSSSYITGTAISANSPSISANQTNGMGVPINNIIFGNTSTTQDIAQSFRTSVLSPLNKIQLYIKKVGSPSNATIKIMDDSNGSVGSNIIASGTLSASAVTTSYGWVEVSFTSNPILDTSKSYWIVVDSSSSSSKYYVIGGTSGNSYTNGESKIGQLGGIWDSTNSINIDYYFNLYLGGILGSISGTSQYNQLRVGTVSGGAQAHTVNYVNSTGNIYCQDGTGNNKSCLSQSDPAYVSYPVSDANINQWQLDASSGGTISGDYNVGYAGATIGPKIINGNLTVSGGGTLTVSGSIWVKGNIILNGGSLTKLSTSYGSNDGIILADGTITVSGGGHADGSGTTGSYLMLLSKSYSTTSAISISGGSGAVIAYAPYGTISVSGGASLKEATGYKLLVEGGSSITYESGLTNNNFSSGPGGTWNINSWKEAE